MNMHRAFGWLILLVALTACSGPSAPASPEATADTYVPPAGTAAAVSPTAALAATTTVVVPVSPTAAAVSPTAVPVTATLAATATPVLPPTSTVGAPAASPTALPPTATFTPLPTATFTPLPTATATATATVTPSPTPTVALAADPYDLGQPDLLDPMDVPGAHWYVWGNPYVRPEVVPGALRLIVDKTSEVTYWIRSDYPPLEDAYVQAVFRTGDSCHHKDRYGLVVRSPSAYEGLLFVVSCDGMFKIFRWNGGLKILQDWTRTTAIHTGGRQTNRVGVWMEGQTLRLYVNNALVAEVQDDLFTSGTIGLLVGADATPGFTVDVDEVAYWILPQPAANP